MDIRKQLRDVLYTVYTEQGMTAAIAKVETWNKLGYLTKDNYDYLYQCVALWAKKGRKL